VKNFWPWLVALGTPIGIILIFTLAYTFMYSARIPQDRIHEVISSWAIVLIGINIAIWTVISVWRIKEDLTFNPFQWKGYNELVAFLVAFLGLHILGIIRRLLDLEIPNPVNFSFPIGFLSFIWAFEEVIFRAYVFNAFGGILGYIISTISFGLHHIGASFQYFLYASIGGLILGGIYWKTEAFWGVFFA